jgi:hypothetical protein
MIRVEIVVDDRGRVSVGAIPQPQRTQPVRPESTSHLQPAADVDDALEQARDILTGAERDADEQMGVGYNRAKPLFSDATLEPNVQPKKY